MEQNIPSFAKKVWRLVRVLYIMLRKNISKSKLLLDLSKMMKRDKIAEKSLHNPFSLFTFHKKHHCGHQHKEDDLDIMVVNAAVMKAMEMIHNEVASPLLPGSGRSPVVRQLRVTDSPFPVSTVDEDCHVDEAAERFISRFYNNLRRQNTGVTLFSSSS